MKTEMTLEIYKFTREFFITFSVEYGIFKSLGWEIPTLLLFFISLLIAISTRFASDNRIKKVIFIIPFILLVIILVLTIFFNINFFLFLKKAFFWNYEYLNGIGEFQLSYSMLFICVLPIVLMKIILYVEKSIIGELILAIILLIFMIICGIRNIQWNPLMVGIMLFCCFNIIVEIYQVKLGGTERYVERCLIPFFLVAALLAICFPSNKEPIKWLWIKSAVSGIQDSVQELVYNIEWIGNEKKNEFNVSKSGFSEEGTSSFGKLIDEKERNMLFVSTRGNVKVGYLNGIVSSTYTGDAWKKEETNYGEYNEEYKIDLYEKLYNLYNSNLIQPTNEYFAKKISYQIRFDKLNTKTIFRPENCYSIYNYTDNIEVETAGNNVYFSKKKKGGYSYYVAALAMNMDNNSLKEYLRELDGSKYYFKGMEKDENKLKSSLFKQSADEIKLTEDEIKYITSDEFRQYLLGRSQKIEKEYLQIPKGIPDRVRILAQEVTKNCTNKYDKAEAICNYLKSNYSYTTDIGELPKGKDAVDYFLFEQNNGYCIYFASAMAIMCRYVDIPTRYVEGVTIDYKDEDEDWFKVKTKAAHAWTEIYLEGFGWIRMDATPGYSENKINWIIDDSLPKSNINTNISTHENDQILMKDNEMGITENIYSMITWLKYLAFGTASIAFVILIAIVLFIWNKKRVYKKSNNLQKVFICIRKIFLNLEKQGYTLQQGETLKEFIERLENDKNFDNGEILNLLEWFQKVRYSKKNITEEEVSWVEHFLLVR